MQWKRGNETRTDEGDLITKETVYWPGTARVGPARKAGYTGHTGECLGNEITIHRIPTVACHAVGTSAMIHGPLFSEFVLFRSTDHRHAPQVVNVYTSICAAPAKRSYVGTTLALISRAIVPPRQWPIRINHGPRYELRHAFYSLSLLCASGEEEKIKEQQCVFWGRDVGRPFLSDRTQLTKRKYMTCRTEHVRCRLDEKRANIEMRDHSHTPRENFHELDNSLYVARMAHRCWLPRCAQARPSMVARSAKEVITAGGLDESKVRFTASRRGLDPVHCVRCCVRLYQRRRTQPRN